MQNIDESCYNSGVYAAGFNMSDILVIHHLANCGLSLSERGYSPAEIGVYLDGTRFITANFITSYSLYGGSMSVLVLENERPAASKDYADFFQMLLEGNISAATILTSGRDITDQVLQVAGLTDIVGKPQDAVPHIKAKYLGKEIAILTGH